jgi:hypothetical protein
VPQTVDFVNGFLVEGDPGVCLRLGDFTVTGSTGGLQLTDEDIAANDNIDPDTEALNIGGIFDFIGYGLPTEGQSYKLAIPQRRPVPANAVYRKLGGDGQWTTFVETENDQLWSTPGEPRICPPPGGDIWQPGLTEGHWCVQIGIADGGPNDADGQINGSVFDPGGVSVLLDGNHLPQATDDFVNIEVDQVVTVMVLDNDSDEDGDSLTITSADPVFGSVTYSDTEVVYTPKQNFIGNDNLVYGISDGSGGTAFANVFIIITRAPNQPPTALDDTAHTVTAQPVVITVLSNDSDPDGDNLQVTAASSASGTVVINADNTITFTPAADFAGAALIDYTIRDAVGIEASAQVRVTIDLNVVIQTKGGGGALFFGLLGLLLLLGSRRWQNRGRMILN